MTERPVCHAETALLASGKPQTDTLQELAFVNRCRHAEKQADVFQTLRTSFRLWRSTENRNAMKGHGRHLMPLLGGMQFAQCLGLVDE